MDSSNLMREDAFIVVLACDLPNDLSEVFSSAAVIFMRSERLGLEAGAALFKFVDGRVGSITVTAEGTTRDEVVRSTEAIVSGSNWEIVSISSYAEASMQMILGRWQ